MARLAVPLLAMMAIAAPLSAQTRVSGVLFDSLLTNRPVVGAQVTMTGSALVALTDARGRFSFEDVPAGTRRLAYWSPQLDSLGLPPVVVDVEVAEGQHLRNVRLAVPSSRAYERERCGREMRAEEGVLVGEVRTLGGAVLPGSTVTVRWVETHVAPGSMERFDKSAQVVVSADGRYGLCGVPRGGSFTVSAQAPDGATSSELMVAMSAPVQVRDVVLADTPQPVPLRGRVLNARGQAIEGALITLGVEDSLLARTDAEGRFAVSLPAGSAQMAVRAIGFHPVLVDESFSVDGSEGSSREFTLEALPPILARVEVTGKALTLAALEFEHRKRTIPGGFVDDLAFDQWRRGGGRVTPTWIWHHLKVGWVDYGLNIRQGFGWCTPKFFIDGNLAPREEFLIRMQDAIRLEIYRATLAPPRFTDSTGCGAVVIWTWE